MSFSKSKCRVSWLVLVIAALLVGCASKRAVPVNCDRRLSPINVPAAPPAAEVTDESEVPEES